ncbi:uncharacterized protein LOC116346516 [Contarinia nasturtii]|uniref:uncharacterized protein LOC116346516 n=1 Tax=Contarinia nasturtii TaxID=265458 RepID=UPI0012D42379|nr:uncharacterized protein LOC116346516 [Contarinia nasturtii]
MEYFLHYITADIKYNFWCEEDGHQFREDWVKCRLNIKYLDSPAIQISCYAVNHYETIPLNIDINCASFRFERAVEVSGIKSNIFVLIWTQNNETNEFYISIDNETQYKNYEIYLNNLMKISRIAENERSEADPIEPLSVSCIQSIHSSSLSLFITSIYIEDDKMTNDKSMAKADNEKMQSSLSLMKRATKYAAKKLRRMFTKLMKPSCKPVETVSSFTASTPAIDTNGAYINFNSNIDDFADIHLSDESRFSRRSTMAMDNLHHKNMKKNRLSSSSFDSTETTMTTLSAVSTVTRDVIANPIVNFDLIYARNESELTIKEPKEGKKIFRKGTPYKMRMSHKLALRNQMAELQSNEREIAFESNENNERLVPTLPETKSICMNEIDPQSKSESISYFIRTEKKKKSFAKQVAQTYRQLLKTIASNTPFLGNA